MGERARGQRIQKFLVVSIHALFSAEWYLRSFIWIKVQIIIDIVVSGDFLLHITVRMTI